MSLIQRLITSLLPRFAASMEADSRAWIIQCSCGYEQSLWEAGGIRGKSAGKTHMYRRCPQCGKRKWNTISRREGSK